MSARPFRSQQRYAAASDTRARILAAARDLLADADGAHGFSIESVAKTAGVARMTVYYQFGSRHELLSALFDMLAEAGGLHALPEAFQDPDPEDAVRTYIRLFVSFWESDRVVMRKLRGLARLDPELGAALKAREERRAVGSAVLAGRLASTSTPPEEVENAAAVLNMLTSFDSYDTLTQTVRPEVAMQLIEQTCLRALKAIK